MIWLLTETITAVDGLVDSRNEFIDSRYLHVWYTTNSVDRTCKTNDIPLCLNLGDIITFHPACLSGTIFTASLAVCIKVNHISN